MARKRAAGRDVVIPAPAEPNRREDCLADVYLFLTTYFAHKFSGAFTDNRREMVSAILAASRFGQDQAIAAPRGEGKTSIAEIVGGVYCPFAGLLRFPVIVAATGPDARQILANIKIEIETNDLLAADFPEICTPVLALEGANQRCGMQTVSKDWGIECTGHRTRMKWSDNFIVFPDVPGSPVAGSVLMTRGADAAIRGLRYSALRPDLAIIDDLETRESANSEVQIEAREQIVEKDIAGLGGPGRRLSRVMLTTCQNRRSLSWKYTDPKLKPFNGKRYKLLNRKPDAEHLWDEYMALRRAGKETGSDLTGRTATAFYLANRAAMDAGSEVTNPERFIRDVDENGEQLEHSALQHCYNIIADRGWDNFATEYQNDPPEETGPVESGITPYRIQRQLSGYSRKEIPEGCVAITRGVDVRKVALHWVVRAWRPDGTGFTIDYGVHEIHGTTYGSDEGLDAALKRAVLAYLEESKDAYSEPIGMTLIDAGWRTDAIYAACAEAGMGVYPVMGIGRSAGCVRTSFVDAQRATTDIRPGDGWRRVRKFQGRIWLYEADADRWKAWEHDRWMTERGKPGCMTIFGELNPNPERLSQQEREHHAYARHICNEVESEEPYKNTIRRIWKAKSENTHWLDASYYSDVAANVLGVRVAASAAASIEAVKGAPMTLRQMAAGGKR